MSFDEYGLAIAKSVEGYLRSLNQNWPVQPFAVSESSSPAFILNTGATLAAFGFSGNDFRRTYTSLYNGFKREYVEHEAEWGRFELSFVFCVPPDIPQLDQFCSRIETDVFFCRKFVVPIKEPVGSSLARLPFLPLAEVDTPAIRPPSAQVFLRQCGMPKTLARYLVAQGERGPDRIIESCLTQEFGPLQELSRPAIDQMDIVEQATSDVRLHSISIKNFRAYRDQQTFDLGEDITLLYGPNGFGKTSLFDALDFVATGEIGRFHRKLREDEFERTATHLDAEPDDAEVVLSFRKNDALNILHRTVRARRHATLNKVQCERKEVLRELTGSSLTPADRVEHLVTLFRATHVFNQEMPELTRDFPQHCRLPRDIVSRMLAFDDYESALGKAERVVENVESILKSNANAVRQIDADVFEAEAQIASLNKSIGRDVRAGSFDVEFSELFRRLAPFGIKADGESQLASLAKARAVLHARAEQSDARINRLAELSRGWPTAAQMSAELLGLQGELDQLKRAAQMATTELHAAERDLAGYVERLGAAESLRVQCANQLAVVDWTLSNKPNYDVALEMTEVVGRDRLRATEGVSARKAEMAQRAATARQVSTEASSVKQQLKEAHQKAQLLGELSAALNSLVAQLAELPAMTTRQQELNERIVFLQAGLRELDSASLQLRAQEDAVQADLRTAEQKQSRFRALLAEVSQFVHDANCPLCGHNHGSVDDLQRRIRGELQSDRLVSLQSSAAKLRDSLHNALKERAKQQEELFTAEKDAEALSVTIRDLRTRVLEISGALGRQGVVLPSSGLPNPNDVADAASRWRLQAARLEKSAAEYLQKVAAAEAAVITVQEQLNEEEKSISALEQRLSRSATILASLRADSRFTLSLFQASRDELLTKLHQARTAFSSALEQFQSAEHSLQDKRTTIQAAERAKASAEALVVTAAKRVSELSTKMQEFSGSLRAADLAPNSTSDDVLEQERVEQSALETYRGLMRSAEALELSLDTVRTAAALHERIASVAEKKRRREQLVQKNTIYDQLRQYFGTAAQLLRDQQNAAVENFTTLYGPRASVLQRRLRAVYGFDSVELSSKEGDIDVRVTRRGVELRPTEFYSQSQQQTLLLGLFLTACVSQTWSALSTIILDDPVTHFDDLNTYAFLDLILGLIEPAPYPHQFVLSTCDERMFRLAVQKFRHLGDRAKFYRFTSIGERGPIIEGPFVEAAP